MGYNNEHHHNKRFIDSQSRFEPTGRVEEGGQRATNRHLGLRKTVGLAIQGAVIEGSNLGRFSTAFSRGRLLTRLSHNGRDYLLLSVENCL